MQLKSLKIEREMWGNDKGKNKGKISFDNEVGAVTLNLTPDMCNKIFEVCAEGIIETAKEAASELTCTVIEHQKKLEG